MKIALLKSDLTKRGGLEKYCFTIAEELKKKGHVVHILTTEAVDPTPVVVQLGKKLPISLLHLIYFDFLCRNWLKKHPVDAVFGFDRNFCDQDFYRAGNGVHAAYLDERKKTCSFWKRLSFSFNPLHHLILAMEKKTFENPKLKTLFTNSKMVQEEVMKYYPKVAHDKIQIVHNGVEWQKFQTPFQESLNKKEIICKSLGLDPARFQFLFIGHEYQRKGLDLLLQALTYLPKGSFQLSVVGKDKHIRHFEEAVQKLHLQDSVHFFGPQKNVIQFYQAADCAVIPSLYDPFANVTIEALAMGLYVVTSSKNGGSEVIASENEGSIFHDLINPQELAHCLLKALQKPKTAQSSLGIRQKYKSFDFSHQIQKFIDLIECKETCSR